MDEEQKSNIDPIAEISQRPKQKINVDSFFNRSADAESITAISLKLASVIEQIDVMKTEIKDIATYITVEHKIEKDLREDRLFEEQDAKQKKEMKDFHGQLLNRFSCNCIHQFLGRLFQVRLMSTPKSAKYSTGVVFSK